MVTLKKMSSAAETKQAAAAARIRIAEDIIEKIDAAIAQQASKGEERLVLASGKHGSSIAEPKLGCLEGIFEMPCQRMGPPDSDYYICSIRWKKPEMKRLIEPQFKERGYSFVHKSSCSYDPYLPYAYVSVEW